ncbi:hypothetical protein HPB50_023788 [Hyalomma asiaticum]|uniref:Uncharacterized protein n=1 Tax=Hyalomma asiaticum TaxID=266040 RepID=A0ACB7RTN9_HYAAI|nr:hypothetical protein HPB50_023788 [Hyalomma asiaticum]
MARRSFVRLILLGILCCSPVQKAGAGRLLNKLLGGSSDVEEDAKLSPAGLMHKNGYPVQVHHVITEDDYILEVDRMPYGVQGDTPNRRTPVLLVHGIISSSADFVINKPHQSAGFLLADRGFDVWLVNCRGTPYSNYHKTLTTSDPEFWEWR